MTNTYTIRGIGPRCVVVCDQTGQDVAVCGTPREARHLSRHLSRNITRGRPRRSLLDILLAVAATANHNNSVHPDVLAARTTHATHATHA